MKLKSAVVLGLLAIPFHTFGQVATFENFTEGPLGFSFVDPLSGIAFSNATNNFGHTSFAVDYGASPNLPPVLPGNYLTIGGYSPGPSTGLGAVRNFTFTLPTPSTHIELDLLYIGNSIPLNVAFSAYSSSGQLLFTTNTPLSTIPTLSVSHPVLSSDIPISSFFVSTPGLGFGFDNIAVPEPASLPLLLLGLG